MILGVVAAAALSGAATVYPVALPLTNPGFETGDATAWTDRSGGAILVSASATQHSGTYHARATADGEHAEWDQEIALPGGIHDDVDAGLLYARGSAWHSSFATDEDNGGLYLDFVDGSNVVISRVQQRHTAPNAYTQEFVTGAIPAGTRKIRVGTCNGRVQGTELSSYCQCSLPNGDQGRRYRAHSSRICR
jgi:hypothetical protein